MAALDIETKPVETPTGRTIRMVMEEATARERERCARLIDLIAADWREAGADQKVWASEYLARQIRDLPDGDGQGAPEK